MFDLRKALVNKENKGVRKKHKLFPRARLVTKTTGSVKIQDKCLKIVNRPCMREKEDFWNRRRGPGMAEEGKVGQV